MAVVRAWALAALVASIWFPCWWAGQPHARIAGANESAATFSAMRAEGYLARVLGPERPHPVGTPENAAVRGRILTALAALRAPAQTYRTFTCYSGRGFRYVACATVTDIVAEVVPGAGKAIVMLAHLDSVPAGPGASDDESGVATILETIRALKAAGGRSKHPVIAVFTDGEEAGLLGANAFLENPKLKARVGAVVNVEARGTSGPSLLFQTSPGDARLIDLYAAHAPQIATSSLYAEIYKFLPNDTDLTIFIRDGFIAYNFAFSDNVRYYHSPRDTRANLNPATLQMHGENLLGMVQGLEQADFAALKSGDDVYVGVLGVWLPRIPAALALPLAIAVLMVMVLAAWMARNSYSAWRRTAAAAAMPLALLIGSVTVGFALTFIAQAISGHPDPTYAWPLAMRVALAFGVWGVVLLVSRMTSLHGGACAAWIWTAVLASAAAAFLPGFSPYFLFPALIAVPLLLATARLRGGWSSGAGQAALLIGALAALVIWMALVASGESLMGLRLHPLFTIPAAFGLMAVVPLLAAKPMPRAAWTANVIVSFALALGGAIVAGLLPAYSAASPQRLNLIYFESANRTARWIADTSWKGIGTEPIPPSLQRAGGFKLDADAYSGLGFGSAYAAPAGAPRYPLPSGSVVTDRSTGNGRVVALRFSGSAGTSAMLVRVPQAAKLVSLRVRGQTVVPPQGWSGDANIACNGPDCRDLAVTLTLASHSAFSVPFAERDYGLPAFGNRLTAARPDTAMPSQSGDGVVLANTINLGAR
jgi:Peptidase family M28